MRNNALFYTCSLIEYMGRAKHRKRSDIVNSLGEENINSIYKYSDVLHCEPIEKISDEYLELVQIDEGHFDNVMNCKYLVPDYWDIGDVYSRLITDVDDGNWTHTLFSVYNSQTCDEIDDYNSSLYCQSRDYLKAYYLGNL